MWHPNPRYPQNQSCYGYQCPLSHDFNGQCFHVNISHGCCWHMPRFPLSGWCIHRPNAMSIGFQELTTASSPENWPQLSGKNLLPWKMTPLRAALIQGLADAGVQKLALLSQGGTNPDVLFTLQSSLRNQAETRSQRRLPPASVFPLPHPASLILFS